MASMANPGPRKRARAPRPGETFALSTAKPVLPPSEAATVRARLRGQRTKAKWKALVQQFKEEM